MTKRVVVRRASHAGIELTARLRAEVRALQERNALLKAQRDGYVEQIGELFVLQQVFTTINSTLPLDDVLSVVMRGVGEALHFGRVVLFDVEDGRFWIRLQSDGEGNVGPPADPHAVIVTPLVARMLALNADLHLGTADDGQAPIADPRHSYCMVPLISRDALRGVLYVDDPPGCGISDTAVQSLFDLAAQAAMAIENARLLANSQQLLQDMERLAMTDSLTGVANRRALTDALEGVLSDAVRHGHQVAFVLLDLDDLKKINDSHGHAEGDRSLKALASAIKSSARREDVVARYAGDEFVVVMSRTDRRRAELAVERILRRIHGEKLRCSVGVSMYPADANDVATLFLTADQALYAAKQAGKDRSTFYDALAQPPAGG